MTVIQPFPQRLHADRLRVARNAPARTILPAVPLGANPFVQRDNRALKECVAFDNGAPEQTVFYVLVASS
jgi:hypothetical protein